MDARITGHLLLPDATRGVRLAPGTLTIRAGRIETVSEHPDPHPDLGGEDYLITPGFIDTHVHLPQFDSIGVGGLELLDWLSTVIFPAEARWKDAGFAGQACARAARELLSFGTTGVAAYATVHHAAAQAAIETLANEGLCGHVGQVLMDRGAPAELLAGAEESLASAARLKPMGRIAPAVTPRFAISCSPSLLTGAAALARSTGWLVQTHLAETTREVEAVGRLFPGETYTSVYAKAGLLTPRTVLAHAVWLDNQDLSLIRASGAAIAHCPTANRFLQAGVMHRQRTTEAGVGLSLGTDVAGGPDRSMVRVARAMIEAAQQAGAAPPAAADCWFQITRGNADVLGLPTTGSLREGLAADVLVIRPTTRWRSSPDPLSHLLYAWDDRWLRATIAAGEVRWMA